MKKSTIILSILSFVLLSQSCSRQKGYFQQNVAQRYQKSDTRQEIKSIEVSEKPVIIESEPILTAKISENFTEINQISKSVKLQERVIKLEKVLAENKSVSKPQKMNFAQKIILKKMQKKVANSGNLMGFHDWNPYLKIGAILLGIGIVLAIFGLGVVGGVSAFLGLIFAILGLLGTV